MLGAHYDHLGHGGRGSSLARAGEETKVHPGADDNASGVAAVLAAAEQLKNGPRGRNVAFVFWSGEEAGLLGSAAFTAKPPLPLDQLAAYFNFDMVGRLHGNALQVQGAGSSPSWAALATSANTDATLKITVQNDPNLPTDSSSFNLAGVPTLSFFTGSHEDYHRPTDTADRVDAAGIDRIVRYATTIVSRVADAPDPPVVRQGRAADARARRARRHPPLHRHDPRLRQRDQGPAPGRRQRRRPGRAGRPAEGRRHRRDCRPVDRQRLRLHLRARPDEAGRAGRRCSTSATARSARRR